ncbi:hypothetical protein ABTZ99_13750 [Actinosynnema sp. NPDC002837]
MVAVRHVPDGDGQDPRVTPAQLGEQFHPRRPRGQVQVGQRAPVDEVTSRTRAATARQDQAHYRPQPRHPAPRQVDAVAPVPDNEVGPFLARHRQQGGQVRGGEAAVGQEDPPMIGFREGRRQGRARQRLPAPPRLVADRLDAVRVAVGQPVRDVPGGDGAVVGQHEEHAVPLTHAVQRGHQVVHRRGQVALVPLNGHDHGDALGGARLGRTQVGHGPRHSSWRRPIRRGRGGRDRRRDCQPAVFPDRAWVR